MRLEFLCLCFIPLTLSKGVLGVGFLVILFKSILACWALPGCRVKLWLVESLEVVALYWKIVS